MEQRAELGVVTSRSINKYGGATELGGAPAWERAMCVSRLQLSINHRHRHGPQPEVHKEGKEARIPHPQNPSLRSGLKVSLHKQAGLSATQNFLPSELLCSFVRVCVLATSESCGKRSTSESQYLTRFASQQQDPVHSIPFQPTLQYSIRGVTLEIINNSASDHDPWCVYRHRGS